MSWLNIAYAFLFVSNLAFMVGAGLVLMRILHASSQTRAELLKAPACRWKPASNSNSPHAAR